MITFANSDGCMSIGPRSNHLRTPNLGCVKYKEPNKLTTIKNKKLEYFCRLSIDKYVRRKNIIIDINEKTTCRVKILSTSNSSPWKSVSV